MPMSSVAPRGRDSAARACGHSATSRRASCRGSAVRGLPLPRWNLPSAASDLSRRSLEVR
eukprot:scaffold33973_cov35-Phaeocystis_antarctica.AAC.1